MSVIISIVQTDNHTFYVLSIIPNIWIYHKDSDLDEVLDYIKEEYDAQIKFDELMLW